MIYKWYKWYIGVVCIGVSVGYFHVDSLYAQNNLNAPASRAEVQLQEAQDEARQLAPRGRGKIDADDLIKEEEAPVPVAEGEQKVTITFIEVTKTSLLSSPDFVIFR